jgi:hypothetical protein
MQLWMDRIFHASALYLRWALLAWVLTMVVLFSMDNGGSVKDLQEPIYQMVFCAGVLGLVAYGCQNIYFGVYRDFSIWEIVRTSLILLFGGVLLTTAFEKMSFSLFAGSVVTWLMGLSVLVHWLGWKTKMDAIPSSRPQPLMNDASIRGGGSLFAYGHDAFRIVSRRETGRNTPAEKFERKLIYYIEKHLQVEPVSMVGSNSNYWRFRLPNNEIVELVVIGPDYNTSAHVKDKWILRIRESSTQRFTAWIAEHFPPHNCIVRKVGQDLQTQFGSHLLENDKEFFEKNIPFFPSCNIVSIHAPGTTLQ